MNRIQQFASVLDSSPEELSTCADVAQYSLPEEGARHWLFAPLHYERNYAYPLIVWLHGPNDDERQLKRVMPLVSMRNYVAVGPRGTVAACEESGQGYAWSQSEDHILIAEHRVLESIESAREKFNISPSRIFLAGLACGGTMAFRIAMNHPNLVAGVLSLGGAFPTGHTPLARINEIRRLRVLLATARDSLRYPAQQVCDNLRLFYAAGMSVSLRQYPCGDELTTQMLSDMDRWIMEQLTSSTAVGRTPSEHPSRGN